MSDMSLPRMRTIAECANLLKQSDPNTAFTKNAIRTKVLAGEIPHCRVGNKRLVNYDLLLETLKNPLPQKEAQAEYGTIRRVM